MEKHTIIVPKGIRYISDWVGLEKLVPANEPYIMNKTITGCGYTEYWITNNQNVIICSPRKALLENKEDQHQDMPNLLYLKDEYAIFEPYDKDLSKPDKKSSTKEEIDIEKAKKYTEYLIGKINHHVSWCNANKLPIKFLVTYDSFRRIKETLNELTNVFTIVVDEFQAIFTDSRFKSDTENSFLNCLKGLPKVIYLSATPMMDKYLSELDEFKDLKYYNLDWSSEDSNRVVKPYLKIKYCPKGITAEIKRIVESYISGNFEKLVKTVNNKSEEVYSREAVFYVNSVKNICDIIRKCKLTPGNSNILCADTPENNKKVKQAFKTSLGDNSSIEIPEKCIGKIPKENEEHKMFTLCTRTVYLGADFYSTNARSFIFSDANIECLSVDISLDLPQILGRQRLDENPWKNRAEFYFILNTAKISQEDFNNYLERKKRATNNLLEAYNTNNNLEVKHDLAEAYQQLAKTLNYKDNFVAVDKHNGSDLKPVFNKLMMLSEMRAFEIQQVDYKDRFSVFNAIGEANKDTDIDANLYVESILSFQYLPDKFRYLCSLDKEIALQCLPHLPEIFVNYYTILGPDRIKALRYKTSDMKREYEGMIGNSKIDIKSLVLSSFTVGDKIPKSTIKNKLRDLYNSAGYSKTPKGTDLEEYFIVKSCKIQNSDGTRDNGYEILSIKS